MSRVLLVGGAGYNEAVDVLHAPVVFHELDGEPIEELRMGWAGTLVAEVLGSFEQSGAEVGLPDPVDESAGGGRGVGSDEPFRKGEARVGITLREGIEEGRNVRFDLTKRFGLFAPLEEAGDAWGLD